MLTGNRYTDFNPMDSMHALPNECGTTTASPFTEMTLYGGPLNLKSIIPVFGYAGHPPLVGLQKERDVENTVKNEKLRLIYSYSLRFRSANQILDLGPH